MALQAGPGSDPASIWAVQAPSPWGKLTDNTDNVCVCVCVREEDLFGFNSPDCRAGSWWAAL